MTRFFVTLIAACATFLWVGLAARCALANVSYPVPTPDAGVGAIAVGPDQSIWFLQTKTNKIGRLSPSSGAITEYLIPTPNARLRDIVAGPDGAMWFTEGAGKIGRITADGIVAEYFVPDEAAPDQITAGVDGALWFTQSYRTSRLGKISTSGQFEIFDTGGLIGLGGGISASPDNSIWFKNFCGPNSVCISRKTNPSSGAFNGSGSGMASRISGSYTSIAAGSDGAIWYWYIDQYLPRGLYRTPPSGETRVFPDVFGGAMTYGADDALWFSAGSIGRASPQGAVRYFGTAGGAADLVMSADRSVWFTEPSTNSVVRLVRRSTVTDFDNDGRSDILFRDLTGSIRMWRLDGSTTPEIADLGKVSPDWSIAAQRDFNGDGSNDILWRHANGGVAMWMMNGAKALFVTSLGNIDPSWTVIGTGDFNADGKGDILWRHSSGALSMWLMNGASALQTISLGSVDSSWAVGATTDVNGDGKADILWRNAAGNLALWLMNGPKAASVMSLGQIPSDWAVAGIGDFNGDGNSDILWRDPNGNIAMWFMDGKSTPTMYSLGSGGSTWSAVATGDYDGDAKADILWRNTQGDVLLWSMQGAAAKSTQSFGNYPIDWMVQNLNAN